MLTPKRPGAAFGQGEARQPHALARSETQVTSPLAGDRTQVAPVAAKRAPLVAHAPRKQRSASLAWGRLRRALRRQAPAFLLTAGVIATFGVGYEIAGGANLPAALLLWPAVGAAGATGLALVREISRNTVTSLQSLGRHRGYAVLGAAPELTARELRQLPPDQRSPLGCLAFMPASSFATAFRDLQGALTGGQIVSFAGATPGEGATTVALCAATSATQQGRNVAIVDCDLRRRALTRGFGLDPEVGVLEACEQPDFWREYVERESETGLNFIPAARPLSAWRSLAAEAGFPALLERLREHYDLVVLDCPPVLATADGAIIARQADKCVLVTAWDETPLSAVRNAMRALRSGAHALTGVYVNRVPPGYRFGRLRPD
jgi:Mrp family chromosome partitioning ATPase